MCAFVTLWDQNMNFTHANKLTDNYSYVFFKQSRMMLQDHSIFAVSRQANFGVDMICLLL